MPSNQWELYCWYFAKLRYGSGCRCALPEPVSDVICQRHDAQW